jgi:hypothetical protein
VVSLERFSNMNRAATCYFLARSPVSAPFYQQTVIMTRPSICITSDLVFIQRNILLPFSIIIFTLMRIQYDH